MFNAVVSERGDAFATLLLGDLALVHASGGLFVVRDPAREAPRASAFEVSPTGPIFGARARAPEGAVLEGESAVLARHGVAERVRIPGIRMRGGRRALRVRPEDAALWVEGDALRLRFALAPGSYASLLVDELLRDAAPELHSQRKAARAR